MTTSKLKIEGRKLFLIAIVIVASLAIATNAIHPVAATVQPQDNSGGTNTMCTYIQNGNYYYNYALCIQSTPLKDKHMHDG